MLLGTSGPGASACDLVAFPSSKDAAALKILRDGEFTSRRLVNVLSHSDLLLRHPCADILFLGFTGISPLKEGFTA